MRPVAGYSIFDSVHYGNLDAFLLLLLPAGNAITLRFFLKTPSSIGSFFAAFDSRSTDGNGHRSPSDALGTKSFMNSGAREAVGCVYFAGT